MLKLSTVPLSTCGCISKQHASNQLERVLQNIGLTITAIKNAGTTPINLPQSLPILICSAVDRFKDSLAGASHARGRQLSGTVFVGLLLIA